MKKDKGEIIYVEYYIYSF